VERKTKTMSGVLACESVHVECCSSSHMNVCGKSEAGKGINRV
jgi:hypothetical protein